MKVILMLSALLALTVAGPITMDQAQPTWEGFKVKFQRQYGSSEEEELRKVVFLKNLDLIIKHNLEADLGQHTYWLGLNEFTDWTHEEFKQRNSFKMAPITTNASLFMAPENLGQLPDSVDWRKEGYVTKVKNQKNCGSCWAFSTTGSLEGQHFRKTGKLVSLSEQNLVDCSHKEGNHGCEGGLMNFGFEYIKNNGGIDTEDCYPYEAEDHDCRFKTSCIGATVTGYQNVMTGDEDALKKAVATVGPVSIAIDASHHSFQMYSHGVYDEPTCSSTQLDHGVLIVGYGTDSSDGDFWIVKNSWGPEWGMDGYVRMSRNKDNQCGVATQASYPLV